MFRAILITNPFEPFRDLRRETGTAGCTIREWLHRYFGPDFLEFSQPTICQLNGKPMLRRDWDNEDIRLQDGDMLVFTAVPGEVVSIVLAVIAIVVAVATILLMPDPKIPADTTQSAQSVYTLRGQTNRYRPNEPIEVSYGKVRHWPTYLIRPYTRYIDNVCYQFSLFCIGQGHFDIDKLQLDDTNINSFDEVEVEVCPPGVETTLIERAVYPSLEVQNIELLGPNQEDYAGPSGPFTLNDADKPIRRIEVDIIFPQGMYFMNSKGKIQSEEVELKFRAREIDSSGTPIGSWFWMWGDSGNDDRLTIERSDNTPQRITKSYTVPLGRYQIEGRRASDKSTSTKSVSTVVWEAAKGYGKPLDAFEGVTVVAMKAMATNQLNDSTSKSFNVIATRKLRTWTPDDGWGALEATRNPIWAFCDVMRASYGAKLADTYLDMSTLYALANTFDAKEITFDWTFDEPLTPWEAARMILRVGRTVPIPQGSLVTAVRDEPQTLPAAIFNQHNIVQGSLVKKLSLFDYEPFDALVVEYTDPTTWRPREVTCVLPGYPGTNPDRMKLPGCTSRKIAYREGMYTLARRIYQRKSVTFRTGLEGHLPSYLDLVMVTHDTVRVGQSGIILDYDSPSKVMTLSQEVEFGSLSLVHKIQLRSTDGSAMGAPITVTPGAQSNQVILAVDPDETLQFGEDVNPPLYAFGLQNLVGFLGKVASIKPVDQTSVELTVVNYVDKSYQNDEAEVTEVGSIEVIRDSTNLVVGWVTVSGVPDDASRVYINFPPTPGAVGYVLRLSYDDGATWTQAGIFPSPPISIGANPGTLKAQISPFSRGGSTIYTTSNAYVVGSTVPVPAAITPWSPQPAWVGLNAIANWYAPADAGGYTVDVHQVGVGTPLRTIDAVSPSVTYSYADLQTDSPGLRIRVLEFKVTPFNAGGDGPTTTISLTNPVPLAPTGLTTTVPGATATVVWSHDELEDFRDYRVYASNVSGFTPGPTNLITTTTSKTASIVTGGAPYYWRVATRDQWGDEESMSVQATV